MTNTIYIHQPEKAFSFTRLPNFLFEAPTFKPLSNEAKVLYAFILRRTELSRKNGWADDCGRIYLYYPICEVVDLLHCGRQKAVNTLRELQYAGLVEIQKLSLIHIWKSRRRKEHSVCVRIRVPASICTDIEREIQQFLEMRDIYTYSRFGVILCLLHIPHKFKNAYFCSQFVAEVLGLSLIHI